MRFTSAGKPDGIAFHLSGGEFVALRSRIKFHLSGGGNPDAVRAVLAFCTIVRQTLAQQRHRTGKKFAR
jgi:hypothetical protein